MKSSRRLSTFHSRLYLNSWLFDFKARHFLPGGVHEFSAQLLHTASLLTPQLIHVQIQTCTSLLSLCLCCVTIPLIWGKCALYIIYHTVRLIMATLINVIHLQFVYSFFLFYSNKSFGYSLSNNCFLANEFTVKMPINMINICV